MEFLSDSIVVVSTILVLVSTCVFPHLFLPCPVLSRTSYDTVEWKKKRCITYFVIDKNKIQFVFFCSNLR